MSSAKMGSSGGNLTEMRRDALLAKIEQWQARVDELEKKQELQTRFQPR